MKIGFSFGRCIRDIVKGIVDYDDVYLIVSRTLIHDSSHVDDVIAEYLFRPEYLSGLDEGQCYDIGRKLYLSGKLFQPRVMGHYPRSIAEDAVWMDLSPCLLGQDENGNTPMQTDQVKAAWKQYQLALKMTSLRKYPSKDEVKGLIGENPYRDDF